MENIAIYEKLKACVGCETKQTIWDNAKLIYEQCKDKKYLKTFANQQEFANYLGITKGRISQYRYAYEYYLLYQDVIDLKVFSVEQVYAFHRTIGSMLFDFLQWVENEKKISWDSISVKNTYTIINEYHNHTKNVNNNCLRSYELTEEEQKIIDFYRNGTNEQKALINAVLKYT